MSLAWNRNQYINCDYNGFKRNGKMERLLLIIDIIKEKIEKDEQDLRNAKIEFTNIKLTTGFE